ncbi:MAG: glycerate kinase [Longimicrobiales bacterium]|nr:glycerate kinase [Longimicrobiales bacterium]
MILICPTAFKGTLSVRDVARAMAAGAAEAASSAEIRTLPLSDGGNGLLTALEAVGGGKGQGARVAGPLGTSVTARFLIQDDRIVVETAEACGLHLVPTTLRDPDRASTRGVGELLRAAVDAAADPSEKTLVVGLGGSATVDAGAGMVSALGWELLDGSGDPIRAGGRGLLDLHAIEPPEEPVALPDRVVLADVQNPLLGEQGAARIFAPQKGASPDDVVVLERGLERWVAVVERELGKNVAALPGAGAAGGLGAAFAAFLDAPPQLGAGWLLDAVGFDAALAEADVVVTGEGAWDEQSSMGKVTGAVVERATKAGVPVLVVAGSVDAPAPEGAQVVGGAEELDTGAIAALVEEAMPGLLARRRKR